MDFTQSASAHNLTYTTHNTRNPRLFGSFWTLAVFEFQLVVQSCDIGIGPVGAYVRLHTNPIPWSRQSRLVLGVLGCTCTSLSSKWFDKQLKQTPNLEIILKILQSEKRLSWHVCSANATLVPTPKGCLPCFASSSHWGSIALTSWKHIHSLKKRVRWKLHSVASLTAWTELRCLTCFLLWHHLTPKTTANDHWHYRQKQNWAFAD